MGNKMHKERLSQSDLKFLEKHTRLDEPAIKEWLEDFMQNCPDGKLTPSKFVNVYKTLFPYGNAGELCEHVFRTFDTDKNGYIDFKEFLLAINVTSSETPEEKLRWSFRIYDVDGNGVIQLHEMTKVVQAIYEMLGNTNPGSTISWNFVQARLTAIFQRMDKNKDGQLTQKEFLEGCLSDEELLKMLALNQ